MIGFKCPNCGRCFGDDKTAFYEHLEKSHECSTVAGKKLINAYLPAAMRCPVVALAPSPSLN